MAFYRSHKKSSSPGPTPTPTTTRKVQVVTHSTGGYDASIYLKLYEGNVLINTKDVLYTSVTSEASSVYCGCVKIWYHQSYGWQLRATETCEYNSTTYYAGDLIRSWTYDTSVDFDVTWQAQTAVVYKTYAYFDGNFGISIGKQYDTNSIVLHLNEMKEVKFYLSGSQNGTERYIYSYKSSSYYSMLKIYGVNLQCSDGGTNAWGLGAWTTGSHTFIENNANGKCSLDGVETANSYNLNSGAVNNYTRFLQLGCSGSDDHSNNANQFWTGYIEYFKITDKTSGDIIHYLRPALYNGVPCMFDVATQMAYYSSGLTVTDTIS